MFLNINIKISVHENTAYTRLEIFLNVFRKNGRLTAGRTELAGGTAEALAIMHF